MSSDSKNCVFCKIINGELPSHRVWEDKKHLAILSIFPNTPGFTVIITKRHLPSYAFENSDKVLTGLTLASKKVARLLGASFPDVGRTGMFFEGFGVDHLHSKLFPMHGTGRMGKWEPIESGSKRKEFYKVYPGYLSSHDSARADDKELEKIARRIRQISKKLKI